MSEISTFFQSPIIQTSPKLQTCNTQSCIGSFGGVDYLTSRSDLEKLSPGIEFFRKLANLQRDVEALRKKQKSDPNSKSLERIIAKKQENIKQLQQIAEKRNQMIFGTLNDIIQTQMGYFSTQA